MAHRVHQDRDRSGLDESYLEDHNDSEDHSEGVVHQDHRGALLVHQALQASWVTFHHRLPVQVSFLAVVVHCSFQDLDPFHQVPYHLSSLVYLVRGPYLSWSREAWVAWVAFLAC